MAYCIIMKKVSTRSEHNDLRHVHSSSWQSINYYNRAKKLIVLFFGMIVFNILLSLLQIRNNLGPGQYNIQSFIHEFTSKY